jgi:hypothetical protein
MDLVGQGLLGGEIQLPRHTESVIDPAEVSAESIVPRRHQNSTIL